MLLVATVMVSVWASLYVAVVPGRRGWRCVLGVCGVLSLFVPSDLRCICYSGCGVSYLSTQGDVRVAFVWKLLVGGIVLVSLVTDGGRWDLLEC
jgi:hypothetical protein